MEQSRRTKEVDFEGQIILEEKLVYWNSLVAWDMSANVATVRNPIDFDRPAATRYDKMEVWFLPFYIELIGNFSLSYKRILKTPM